MFNNQTIIESVNLTCGNETQNQSMPSEEDYIEIESIDQNATIVQQEDEAP